MAAILSVPQYFNKYDLPKQDVSHPACRRWMPWHQIYYKVTQHATFPYTQYKNVPAVCPIISDDAMRGQ